MNLQIQGLRGLAVLLVIFYHFKIPLFNSGYIGVDIFFVISGYVITKILLKKLENQNMDLKRFYQNRMRRLVPNLIVAVTITSIFAYLLGNPLGFQQEVAKSGITSILGINNLYLMKSTQNYFGIAADSNPLIHMWSLGVEFQFYILFPIFLLLFNKKFKRHNLSLAILITFMTSLVFNIIFLTFSEPLMQDISFFNPGYRAWEFLAGVLIASIKENNYASLNHGATSITGYLLIIAALFIELSDTSIFNQIAIRFFAVIGTALIVFRSRFQDKNNFLGTNLMVYIGNRSYSLYLWHWPTLVFCNIAMANELSAYIIAFILMALLSLLSYRFVEVPFYKGKLNSIDFNKFLFIFLPIPLILSLILGLNAKYLLYPEFNKPGKFLYSGQVANSNKPNQVPNKFITCLTRGYKIDCTASPESFILLLGDSHAGSLTNALADQSEFPLKYLNSKAFSDSRYDDDLDLIFNFINLEKPRLIVLAANWDRLGLSSGLLSFLSRVNELDIKLFVLEDNPNFKFDAFTCAYGVGIFVGRNKCSGEIYLSNFQLPLSVRKYKNIEYLLVKVHFYQFEDYSMVLGKEILYFDSHHLNARGASYLLDKLLDSNPKFAISFQRQ